MQSRRAREGHQGFAIFAASREMLPRHGVSHRCSFNGPSPGVCNSALRMARMPRCQEREDDHCGQFRQERKTHSRCALGGFA
jgi:hypothetical protein